MKISFQLFSTCKVGKSVVVEIIRLIEIIFYKGFIEFVEGTKALLKSSFYYLM